LVRLTINTDGFEATVGVEPDGRVFQGNTLLLTDPEFLERHPKEKVRMIREARSRLLRDRFDVKKEPANGGK